MPKISDEFKSQPQAAPGQKPDGRTPQPVIKLAPMAPRSHAHQPAADTPAAKDERIILENQNSDGLAEKLRAQRAAAEMLAVQRVSAARQRAEARIAAEPSPPPQRSPSNDVVKKTEGVAKNVTAPPPKFTFADDGPAAKRQDPVLAPEKANGVQRTPSTASVLASLTPPRPALGGDRLPSSLLRQPASPFRPDQSPPFRPIDPATGYTTPSSRLPPLGGQRPYLQEPAGFAHSIGRDSGRKLNEPYRRGQEIGSYGAELRGEEWPGDPRLGRALASRGQQARVAEVEFDDVFEDETPPPRRRAGASDYRSAYREAEDSDTDDRRRSNGPWLLLLALLVAAFATGGVILLYKSKPATTTASNSGDSVPLIAAPEQPAKTAAEKPAAGSDDLAAVNRKQIYDRIVGDREVTGDTVVPTEVTPIQPEADEPGTGGIPQITGSGDQEPGVDDAVPLALPPASGEDTQGKIDQDTDQRVVAAAGQSEVEEVKTRTTTQGGDTIASLLPATGTEEEAAVAEPRAVSTETQPVATEPKPISTETASTTTTTSSSSGTIKPEVQSPPRVQKKITTAKKKKPSAETTASLGAPLVIVPPGEIAAPSQQSVETSTSSPTDTVTTKQAAPQRKRTLFDLFNGNKNNSPAQDTAIVKQSGSIEPAPQQKTAETKVASLQAEPAPEKQSGGSGYVVQLASFRSQDEAQTEYARLRSKYPSVIGNLPSSITQATVAGSTRHRLGLGPVATRDQASQVCGSLIAAGERDCLVRKQ
ncbi:MAG TPA: SPOR domain-containing protein [Aestuariivirga sp.]|nr:SPOR domain-containing protein [Aestuariivirga sp.]